MIVDNGGPERRSRNSIMIVDNGLNELSSGDDEDLFPCDAFAENSSLTNSVA